MSARPPIVYLFAWKRMIVSVGLLLAIFFLFCWLFTLPVALVLLVGASLLIQVVRNRWLLGDIRRGTLCFRRREFDEAIKHFSKADRFLEAHPWIDRWRTPLLFSPVPYDYRSICWHSMGMCHARLGRLDEAKNCYRRSLEISPNNQMAAWSLESLTSVESAVQQKLATTIGETKET